MPEEIENPWCVYGIDSAGGFGKIVREDKPRREVWIKYGKSQNYHPQLWGEDDIQRFATLEDAAKEYQKQRNEEWA